MIQKYKHYFKKDNTTIPFDKNNQDYLNVLEEISQGVKIIDMCLQEIKQDKLRSLKDFHESQEVKSLKIRFKNQETFIGLDASYRYLMDEQIGNLKLKKDKGEINPTWTYQNGISVVLDLALITNLRIFIADLIDYNFKVNLNHQKLINALTTVEEVENYNFKKDYKINQILVI